MVSIIMPSYNKAAHIQESIDSIKKQTHKNWELLIIDDCSTDNSVQIINENLGGAFQIRLNVNENNKGANYCRNKGIKLAKGDYLLFMDADDLLSASCLERRLFTFENKNLDFAVFTMQVFNQVPGDDQRCWKPNSKHVLRDFLAHDLPWQTMQPLWKRDFVISTEGFDENFERMQDVDFHTNVLLKEPKYQMFVGVPDCYYRIDEKRKNFSAFKFLEKWVNSTLVYLEKYRLSIKDGSYYGYLSGTLYQTYVHLLYERKMNKISEVEFLLLETKLFSSKVFGMNLINKLLFRLTRIYNLKNYKLVGINLLLKKLIIKLT